MKASALTVVHGQGPSKLSRPAAAPRLRPGERPVAVELCLMPIEIRAFRAAAREVGMGVDAYVSLFLEYQSLCECAGRAPVAALADAMRDGTAVNALAAVELQIWHRLITGRVEPPGDDLPTVFIPLRLATALHPSVRTEAVRQAAEADTADLQRAIALETAATVSGVVMQTWVLAQLAGVSGGAVPTL